MFNNLTQTTLYRVQPLLLTVFGIAACQNLFFLLLPLQLQAAGHDSGPIGLAMSFYAFGAIIAGMFGAKVIAFTGHIRTFSLMSAVMVIVATLHSFYDSILLTGILRAIAGFSLIINFITLESWLNVVTDNTNRARIFSVYQICVGIGGVCAPFILTSFELSDPRLFGLVGVFLSISIMIMSITRLPMPQISEKTNPLPFKEMWSSSPSGTMSCFCAGLLTSVSVTLIAIYASERAFTGFNLSIILSSVVLGGFITQYPTGWFADRFDKRTVASALMAIGLITNGAIIFDSIVPLPMPLLLIAFLISGGSAVALFPLAVTQVFDQIDPKDAVRATGTLQITLGAGGFLGPIIAGNIMDIFGSISLFYYIAAVHIFVMCFLLVRKLFMRQEKLKPSFPFQVTTAPTRPCRTGLDPRVEYDVNDVGEPTLKLLLLALSQDPKEPSQLIKSALETTHLEAIDIAIHLVLALPKNADQMIGILVTLQPEKRLEIAQSLYELLLLRKKRINALVQEGLCLDANEQERSEIAQLFNQAHTSNDDASTQEPKAIF